jgi:DNA repair protein RadC
MPSGRLVVAKERTLTGKSKLRNYCMKETQDQPSLLEVPVKHHTSKSVFNPKEFKVQALRECPTPVEMQLCDTPEKAAAYWRSAVVNHPYYNPQVECMVVVLLNTRRRIQGHHLVATGTLDTLLVHPREIFRVAVVAAAAALLLMHNHPSGDPAPSEGDIKVTRDLIRAGQLMKIEVIDHVIVGLPSPERVRDFCSLKEAGFFYS